MNYYKSVNRRYKIEFPLKKKTNISKNEAVNFFFLDKFFMTKNMHFIPL